MAQILRGYYNADTKILWEYMYCLFTGKCQILVEKNNILSFEKRAERYQ